MEDSLAALFARIAMQLHEHREGCVIGVWNLTGSGCCTRDAVHVLSMLYHVCLSLRSLGVRLLALIQDCPCDLI